MSQYVRRYEKNRQELLLECAQRLFDFEVMERERAWKWIEKYQPEECDYEGILDLDEAKSLVLKSFSYGKPPEVFRLLFNILIEQYYEGEGVYNEKIPEEIEEAVTEFLTIYGDKKIPTAASSVKKEMLGRLKEIIEHPRSYPVDTILRKALEKLEATP
jgi:hypothetical protein